MKFTDPYIYNRILEIMTEQKEKKSKMYILIKETIPLGFAIVAASHASVACFRKYQTVPAMQEWLATSFRKVICKVTEEEFEQAKQFKEEHILLTESNLEGAETALAFRPRIEWSKPFGYFKLYK